MIKSEMNRIRNKRGGYTLVEMIVVLVIMAILAGLAIGGIIAYQRYSMFKKNNEYAKTIFMSAQNALTHVKTTGQIDDLEEQLKSINAKVLTKSDIKDAYEDQLPEERVYSVIFNKEERKSLTGVKKELYELITPYIYDADILNATFSVEFDPVDGTVWGVCYNDKASTFDYKRTENTVKDNDIALRKESVRREVLLGYYGVDMLSDRAPEGSKEKIIEKAEIVNEDTLRVTWVMGADYSGDEYDYDFQVTIGADTDKVYEFTIKKEQIKKFGKSAAAAKEITCDSITAPDGTKTTDVPFLGYLETSDSGETVYNLVLDAVDYTAGKQVNETKADYKQTYSILRLFPNLLENRNEGKSRASTSDSPSLNSMNLYVSMQASGAGTKSEIMSIQGNALFASENVESVEQADGSFVKTVTYCMDNIRHLYNVRFVENALTSAKAEQKNVVYIYRQQSRTVTSEIYGDKLIEGNIIWSKADTDGAGDGIVEHGWVFDKRERVLVSDDNPASSIVFPSINELGEKRKLVGVGDKDDPNLVEGKSAQYSIQGLNLTEADSAVTLGLFKKNSGTIQNIGFITARVNGQNYVGTACGLNSGILSDISTDKTSTVQGKKYVGGIAGSDVTGKPGEKIDAERLYQSLSNAAEVKGESYVGGIVSYNYKVRNGSDSSITKCSNTGFVQAAKKEGICIGGIVGYNREANITECTSNPLKEGYTNETAVTYMNGYFVGGIVGFNRGGTVSKVKVGSDNENERGVVTGYMHVGGIAGLAVKSFGDSDSTVFPMQMDAGSGADKSTSSVNIAGNQNVGGVIGSFARINNETDGGITKILNGTVSPDKLGIETKFVDSDNKITGWEYTGNIVGAASLGGIVGYNNGIIENSNVGKINIDAGRRFGTSMSSSQDVSNVGGIVGGNNGIVVNCNVTEIKITASGNYLAWLGGIAGTNFPSENTGEIKSITNSNVGSIEFVIDNKRDTSSLGGIVGNTAILIQNCSVEKVDFKIASEPYNWQTGTGGGSANLLGGIAGSMAYTGTTIDSCQVGAVNFELGETKGDRFGGVAGANPTEISNSSVGSISFVRNTAEAYLGGIAGENSGTLSTVSVGSIQSSNGDVGGIVYKNYRKITNATVNSLSVSGKNVGGIAYSNTGNISLASSTAIIANGDYVGGIAAVNSGTISQCYLAANASVTATGSYVGGIAAQNEGTVSDCGVQDRISITASGNYVGGLIGYNSGELQNVASTVISGSISGKANVGGYVGYQKKLSILEISQLKNTANISGTENIGGIIGCLGGGGINVTNSQNTGAISTSNQNGGGIIGKVETLSSDGKAQLSFEQCINYGKLDGKAKNRGGIIGLVANQNSSLEIIGSVNVGTIANPSADYSCAGIVGNNQIVDSFGYVMLLDCKNYGLPSGEGTSMAGILGRSSSDPNSTVVQSCYGVAQCRYPITNVKYKPDDRRKSYYFVKEKDMPTIDQNGYGTPLYIYENGGKYTAKDATGATAISNMPMDPTKLVNSSDSELYYNGLNSILP